MEIRTIIIYIIISHIMCINAKISGGPRGRFSKAFHTKTNNHVSAHYAHYSYHPPSHILYTCRYCANPASYPVFHGLPPTYVYKYRESGSRFGDVLTGLALYNLGRSARADWHHTHFYAARPDEKCSLQVIDRTHFEETSFPCFMMSSFMERAAQVRNTVPDTRLVDITSPHIEVKSFIQNNGSPITVTREQECVLWHNLTTHKERNHLPCALLKEYAETMKSSGIRVAIWLPVVLGIVVAVAACGRCCCKKNKHVQEDETLNQTHVVGYRSNY